MSSNSAVAELTQLISKHLIKPMPPTPSPQTLNSSKFGDASPDHPPLTLPSSSSYIPLTLFYPAKPKTQFHVGLERAQALKRSLAQSLIRFYPPDSSVLYVEARFKIHMSKFLKRPDFSALLGFLTDVGIEDGLDHAAKIQVSIFECGGIAVTVLISLAAEGFVSLSGFLKDWAGGCRGFCGKNINAFRVDFRPNEHNLMPRRVLNKGRAVTRRLIFDSEAIASLKTITMSSQVQHPTAIEAVSSLIWKCTMDLLGGKLSAGPKTYALALSSRARGVVTAFCDYESRIELDGLVQRLRGAITEGEKRGLGKECDEMDYIVCYGWCGSGFYEVDFGWGRPVWVTSSGSGGVSKGCDHRFLNSVVLVETRWGDGIEAWVTLDAKVMGELVRNEELLTFASTSP